MVRARIVAMWSALVPLIIGSALVPMQIVVTILLLRSDCR